MPAPSVKQPEGTTPPAPETKTPDVKLPNGIAFTDGPRKGKNDSFLPAAYEIHPGVIRIDR